MYTIITAETSRILVTIGCNDIVQRLIILLQAVLVGALFCRVCALAGVVFRCCACGSLRVARFAVACPGFVCWMPAMLVLVGAVSFYLMLSSGGMVDAFGLVLDVLLSALMPYHCIPLSSSPRSLSPFSGVSATITSSPVGPHFIT